MVCFLDLYPRYMALSSVNIAESLGAQMLTLDPSRFPIELSYL